MTAKTTAEVLFNNFFVHYSFPKRIHADQGANFESTLIKELCQVAGIDKSRTTSYHPQGNGMTERFNRTLISMLGSLQPSQKTNWKTHVAPLVHAYNSTKHESTGYSPFSLMFAKQPRLPIDVAFGIGDQTGTQTTTVYAKCLRERLAESYQLATSAADKARNRQKGSYDVKVRGAVLGIGDRVLVKQLAFEGRHKLADKWEEDVYCVLDQPNQEIPVF
jgi:hypothetical protein